MAEEGCSIAVIETETVEEGESVVIDVVEDVSQLADHTMLESNNSLPYNVRG